MAFTVTLNPWTPGLGSVLAILATVAEVALSFSLVAGFKLRWTGIASACLLGSFSIGMMAGMGAKAPLDYSVFTAIAASVLVAFLAPSAASPPSAPSR